MKNLTWSVGDWNGNEFISSNKVEDVFWHQHKENGLVVPDGLYPFHTHYGLIGKIKIQNGLVDVEHLDKQIPKRYRMTNDQTFVELMTINNYGLIEIFLGS